MMIRRDQWCLRKALFIFIFVWFISVVYFLGVQHSKDTDNQENILLQIRYNRLVKELGTLKERNSELGQLLENVNIFSNVKSKLHLKDLQNKAPKSMDYPLLKEYEISRRELDRSINELFNYLSDQFEKNSGLPFASHAIDQMLSLMGQSAAFASLGNNDAQRAEKLSKLHMRFRLQLEQIQNPKNCSSARKLICELDKTCGFGCQIHNAVYCLIVSFFTNRTMLFAMDGLNWNYAREGWNSAFIPITNCSYEIISKDGDIIEEWDENNKGKVVVLPFVDRLRRRPHFLPLAFPESMASELLTLHSYPPVYFVSMFLTYLMRPTKSIEKRLKEAIAKVQFDEGPIVGLQVRRTDKIGYEAAFHNLNEYMKWAERWFRIQEYRTKKKIKRKVFIATDDATVVATAKNNYSNYIIYGDENIAKSASLTTRYGYESLVGLLIDIELLSRCDYLVCTFSSQVCRAGFELMQVRVGDAGNRFHSLDDIYYFGGQQDHEEIAVESYKAESPNEIDILPGDLIGIAGNHWNGFSMGTNRRTGKRGLYPSYKTREKWILVPSSRNAF